MRIRLAARAIGSFLLKVAIAFILLSVAGVAMLRWFEPPASSFMVRQLVEDWMEGDDEVFVYFDWVAWESISPHVALAVVAAEDQRFPHHHGFDFAEIGNALRDYSESGRLRGASTISQQVAKNLFLWPGRSMVRKALEGWFTLLLEGFLPKRRIMELYLNIAQFGPDIFGVGPASLRYFKKRPADVSLSEASLLAAVLPNPQRYKVNDPSAYVRARARWIREQTRNLGSDYLQWL